MMNMVKKATIFALLLVLAISMTSCGSFSEVTNGIADGIREGIKSADITQGSKGNTADSNTGSKVIKSSDGKFQLSVPSNWKEDSELNDEAILQVSNRVEEKYVIVINEGKDGFSEDVDSDYYTDLIRESMYDNLVNPQISDNQDITINNMPAKYFEISGEADKIKISYMVVISEDRDNFNQVIGWTSTPKFDDKKQSIGAVMKSFESIK